MSRFRKNTPRKVPSINTAALPDLIFTLLFFFLLATNMRSVPMLTHVNMPNAAELQKLKEKSMLIYILVGKQLDDNQKDTFDIQLNSEIINFDDLSLRLQEIKEDMLPDELNQTIVVLKIDRDAPMGLVNDIRQTLREAHLQTVYYTAERSRN